jgi:transposase
LWANPFTAFQRFLASTGVALTIQPPCSPDLAPAEKLSLIPEVKIDLKGSRFQDAEEMKNATTQIIGRLHLFIYLFIPGEDVKRVL